MLKTTAKPSKQAYTALRVPTPVLCCVCKKPRPVWKRENKEPYCQSCWRARCAVLSRGEPKKLKQYTPIKQKSTKKTQQDKLYSKLRKEFLQSAGNTCCRAGFEGCTGCLPEALSIHHKRGRGEFYLDTSTWVTLCLNCHRFITDHSALAQELGYTQSRYSA